MSEDYRILSKGEIIQAGDMIDRCSDPWRDEPVWESIHLSDIGKPAPDPAYPSHRIYRRKVLSVFVRDNGLGPQDMERDLQ